MRKSPYKGIGIRITPELAESVDQILSAAKLPLTMVVSNLLEAFVKYYREMNGRIIIPFRLCTLRDEQLIRDGERWRMENPTANPFHISPSQPLKVAEPKPSMEIIHGKPGGNSPEKEKRK